VGKLYILRHGNTFDAGDIIRRVGCRTDMPLSLSGLNQAKMVAQMFATKGIFFERAYCSALMRTRQTAEEVLKVGDNDCRLTVLSFLNEIDYGPDENQPESAVVERIGNDALFLWDTQGLVPQGWLVEEELIRKGWQLLLQETALDADRNVLVVTSNGIARFVLPLIARMEGEVPLENLKLGTCRYGVVDCKPEGAEFVAWNVKF
jgi:broad specificity phosphatase PhoE